MKEKVSSKDKSGVGWRRHRILEYVEGGEWILL
jgi:hypothetical protein